MRHYLFIAASFLIGCLLRPAAGSAEAPNTVRQVSAETARPVQQVPLPQKRATEQTVSKIDSLKQLLTTTTDTARVKVLYALVEQVYRNNYSQGMNYAQRGLDEARRIGWKRGQAKGLEYLGFLEWRRGRFTQAHQQLLAALALWRRLQEKQRIFISMHSIADLLSASKQFDAALAWERKALAGALAAHDTLALINIYSGFGSVRSLQRRYADALPHYHQARALGLRYQHKSKGVMQAKNDVLRAVLNNMADAYIELDLPRAALPYLFEALRMVRQTENKAGEGVLEATLGQAYAKMGKVGVAIYHGRTAHKLLTEAKSLRVLIGVNDLLNTWYIQQGNYRLAHQYLAQNRALETKMRQEEQAQKVAELQGRYDTKEKERSIELLTQKNKIAQLATLQQRTLRNAALIIAGLLLLAIGILYNRYRLRQRTVQLLDEQNREKTLLLQEVHHRVKNNLQIIMSLLDAQLFSLQDAAALDAIRESQSRVQSMALLHQQLYQSESMARVDLPRYIADLLASISGAYRAPHVTVVVEIAPVHLTTQTAVPLGLIVNELVTNAYKYAFEGPGPGKLLVSLTADEAGRLCLRVADNGPGLPPLHLDMVQSLGLQLTVGLVRQLHATLRVERHGGTTFIIDFRDDVLAPGAAPPAVRSAAAVL